MNYSILATLLAVALLSCNSHEKGSKEVAMAEQQETNDLRITQDIRKALTDNKTLSLQAKNVEVVTEGGNVELAGSVESESEKRAVAAVAQTIYGVKQVNNKIEITVN